MTIMRFVYKIIVVSGMTAYVKRKLVFFNHAVFVFV